MLRFLIMPLFGGFTGYVTNYFAIKMLFKPHKPLYIGKFHIPFTPGLIIREKDRITRSIGNAVGEKLLDKDTVEKALLSDKVINNINSSIQTKLMQNDKTIAEFIKPFTQSTAGQAFFEAANDVIVDRLENFHYGEMLAETILSDNPLLSMMSRQIGNKINSGISENAQEIAVIIWSEISNEAQRKISDTAQEHKDDIPYISSAITELYVKMIKNKLGDFFENINISEIIQDKLSEFNVVEFEDMVIDIVNKELRIIEYLGAVFGFCLGLVLAFLNF